MLYDQDAPDLPARAEDIVGTENGGETTALTAAARQRLADPDNARFLIDQRMDEELRHRWTIEDVEERLQRYVVLDYPTQAAAEAAFQRLSHDRNVVSVSRNGRSELSAIPSDPLFAPDFTGQSEFYYQWAIHDTLNLAGAWDITHGTAYVGVVDTGIQVTHPDLQQAFRPHFSKNVSLVPSSSDVDERSDNGPIAGHGTHVAGIVAASADNAGTAGICWRCSLILAKFTRYAGGLIAADDARARGIVHAVQSGAQVVNLSGGNDGLNPSPSCSDPTQAATCDALVLMAKYSVVMAAASGNINDTVGVQFPASDPRVIPVAGIQAGYPDLWQHTEFDNNGNELPFGSRLGVEMAQRGLLAPARDVLSTVYTDYDWAPYARCGDSWYGPSPASNNQHGYGTCTGTSMAAPHVSGIAALMRGVDPMQPSSVVRSRLLSTADNATSPNNQRGYGVPRANLAVTAMLNGNPWRLTPLFALQGNCGGKWFYTVAPQMAIAAINGTLLPGPLEGCKMFPNVGTRGNPLPAVQGKGSYAFPGLSAQYFPARAQVWVFSTHNPRNSSVELKPLYRLSRSTGVHHMYSTSTSEVQTFINYKGFRMDGIEGYLYPANLTPPAGAVRLIRASKDPYNSSNFAVFPETLQADMQAQGYVHYTTELGWAFPNNGTRPTY